MCIYGHVDTHTVVESTEGTTLDRKEIKDKNVRSSDYSENLVGSLERSVHPRKVQVLVKYPTETCTSQNIPDASRFTSIVIGVDLKIIKEPKDLSKVLVIRQVLLMSRF